MNTAVIILIIILFLILVAGIAVGLYFALRKKEPTGGTGPRGITGPAPGVTGTNNPPPPGGVTGDFSIRSVHDRNRFLTFNTDFSGPITITSPGEGGDLIATTGGTGSCSNFSWKNVGNLQFSPDPIDTVTSALVSNASRVGTTPPPFVATLINVIGTSVPPFDVVLGTAGTRNNAATIQNYNWSYNATNKTWCGPGSLANNCLYLKNDNTVKATTFVPSDTRFQWDNVTPIASPNCL